MLLVFLAFRKRFGNTGANRELTKEQFKNMSWDEVWKRAIPIEDKEAFIRENKKRKP